MNTKEGAKSNQVATPNQLVPSPLSRLAGPAAVVAGALLTVSQLVMLTLDRTDRVATLNSTIYKVTMAGYVIGFFALMVALVAMYQRQALQAGTFGVVARCAAIAGTMDCGECGLTVVAHGRRCDAWALVPPNGDLWPAPEQLPAAHRRALSGLPASGMASTAD